MNRLWLPMISNIFNWPLSKSTLTGLLSKSNSIAPWLELHFTALLVGIIPFVSFSSSFYYSESQLRKLSFTLWAKYICDRRWSYPIFKYFWSRLLSIILWVEYLLQGFSAEKIFNYILSQYQRLPFQSQYLNIVFTDFTPSYRYLRLSMLVAVSFRWELHVFRT